MSEKKVCYKYSGISLKNHQKQPVYFLSKAGNKGIIAHFGTGTGKSITALTTALS